MTKYLMFEIDNKFSNNTYHNLFLIVNSSTSITNDRSEYIQTLSI